jgi:hypothetical protein
LTAVCRRRAWPPAILLDQVERIVANVVGRHLAHQLILGDDAGVGHLREKGVDEGFLVAVRVALVAPVDQPPDNVERPALPQRVIDREAGLPRLRPALGGVQDPGLGV